MIRRDHSWRGCDHSEWSVWEPGPGIVTFQHGRGVMVIVQICKYKELLTHNVWDRRKIITSLQLNILCSKPIISVTSYRLPGMGGGGRDPHTNVCPWYSEGLPAFDIYFILGSWVYLMWIWQIWTYLFMSSLFHGCGWWWMKFYLLPAAQTIPCRGRGWDPGYEALIYCFSVSGPGTCHW